MNNHDSLYLNTCDELLQYGRPSSDRTGTGTTKAPGLNMRFFMEHGFPLLTSKFTPIRLIELELRMFLNGITDNNFLKDQNVHIWDAFTNEDGELGPVYGAVWRDWPTGAYHDGQEVFVDQIAELMKGLREKPMSRRHIVTGWNPALLPIEGRSHAENVNAGLQALPPCHTMWQVHCHELTVEEREEQHKLRNGSVLMSSKTESFRHQVLDRIGVPKYGVSLQLYQRKEHCALAA